MHRSGRLSYISLPPLANIFNLSPISILLRFLLPLLFDLNWVSFALLQQNQILNRMNILVTDLAGERKSFLGGAQCNATYIATVTCSSMANMSNSRKQSHFVFLVLLQWNYQSVHRALL